MTVNLHINTHLNDTQQALNRQTSLQISTMSNPHQTFETIYASLLTHPAPLLPPARPRTPSLTATISSLSLHPTLEAALHILNADLPSAHFLVRHMQAAPAHEGMYLHGILHRIEGDYDNARAWYGDVAESDVFRRVWGEKEGGKEGALGFVGRVEALRKAKGKGEGKGVREEREGLERESGREIGGVVEWCVGRFGTEAWGDASAVWTRPDEVHRVVGNEMVSGGKGYREF
jgi:hypothetical protein